MVLLLFLMEFKNKFISNCNKNAFIPIDYSKKFTTIKSLCELIGIITEEYIKGRLDILTADLKKDKYDDLKGHDLKLIDEVIYNTYKFNPLTSSLEDKLMVAKRVLSSIYKDKVDYLVALAMFYHMASDKSIILQNTNFYYFDKFIENLVRDYDSDLKIIRIDKRSDFEKIKIAMRDDHKAIIKDPLALLKEEDGEILDLEGLFKEELPASLSSLKQ